MLMKPGPKVGRKPLGRGRGGGGVCEGMRGRDRMGVRIRGREWEGVVGKGNRREKKGQKDE